MLSSVASLLARIARRLVHDERGGSYVEYALLVSLIAVFCIVALSAFGLNIFNGLMGDAGQLFPGA